MFTEHLFWFICMLAENLFVSVLDSLNTVCASVSPRQASAFISPHQPQQESNCSICTGHFLSPM